MGNNDNTPKKFRIKGGDAIHAVLFFTSVALAIWAIYIYRVTIIEVKYLSAIVIAGSIIALFLLSFWVTSSYSKFWNFFIRASIGGGIFYFAFLFLNQKYASNDSIIKEFQIIKKGTLSRGKSTCSQPYVVIDFNGLEKELLFTCDFSDAVKHSKGVIVNYSKGFFGLALIKSKQLSD